MKQSRMISFIEACIGTAIGFAVSITLSIFVYPLFGHAFTLAQNFWITAIFTVASVARTYAVRRWADKHLQTFVAWTLWGRLHVETKEFYGASLSEYAVVSTRTAKVVGYWAYGSWDPNQPYQGGPALWTK